MNIRYCSKVNIKSQARDIKIMYKLDDTDIRILRILQTDTKLPLTQLSEQLGIPHGTIRDRIRKMEDAGVIESLSLIHI